MKAWVHRVRKEISFRFRTKRLCYHLGLAFRYYVKRADKTPVFVIGAARSGSTLLVDYLRSSPDVSCAGPEKESSAILSEVINPYLFYGVRSAFISKRAVLRHIAYSLNHCEKEKCVAKLLFRDLENHHIELSDLGSYFPKAKFVVIFRESLSDQFISYRLAKMRDAFWETHSRDTSAKPVQRFKMDPEDFLSYREAVKRIYHKIERQSSVEDRLLYVSYERLREETQKIFDEELGPFLGIKKGSLSTVLKKQNPLEPREVVENYDEVRILLEEDRSKHRYPTR